MSLNRSARRFYAGALAALALLSAYPLYMGARLLLAFARDGYILSAEYPRYVIPYAPLAVALLASAALLPLLMRKVPRRALLLASIIGAALFVALELPMEKIPVLEGYRHGDRVLEAQIVEDALPAESWQYALCVATPQVLRSIGEPEYAENNPAYKVHYYLIALLILLSAVHIVHGNLKMRAEGAFARRRPLTAQLICVAVFVGLCALACATAFYRTGDIVVSPLSAFLMGLFFIVFGVSAGVWLGCFQYGKRPLRAVWLPAAAAMATTLIMYAGELLLMGGELFRLGTGPFFEPLGAVPLSAMDVSVVLLSGLTAAALLRLIRLPPAREPAAKEGAR